MSVKRLEALCAYAESAMHRARHAHEAATASRTQPQRVEQAPDDADGRGAVFDTAALLGLARQLRGFGRIPVLPATPEEVAGLDHRRAAVDRLDIPSRAGQLSRHPGPRRWGSSVLDLRPSSASLPLALRVLLAALVASALSHAVGLGHTSWAAVSATAVLQSVNRTSTLNRGVQRAVGTGGGLLVGVGLLALSPGASGTILLVIGFQVLAELVVMVNYAFALVFATPVALLLAHLGHAIPASALVRDRLVDTLIGALIGVLCAVVIPNRRLAGALRQAMHLTAETVDRAGPSGDEQSAASTDERLRLARELALALSSMRGAYDAAAGEPWPEDLPAESFLRLERHGFRELARLTAGPQDQTP